MHKIENLAKILDGFLNPVVTLQPVISWKAIKVVCLQSVTFMLILKTLTMFLSDLYYCFITALNITTYVNMPYLTVLNKVHHTLTTSKSY